MKVVVTCGPSYEPIDQVRRITNFSTGELGLMLARNLLALGHEVLCFKGVQATAPLTDSLLRTFAFTTNEDLRRLLEDIKKPEQIGAVFHSAALCDFRVVHTRDGLGASRHENKISSRVKELTLTLEPAAKLIHKLRPLFPKAWIVGWKYELNGTKQNALAAAAAQIEINGTNACIINGSAYGEGFGYVAPEVELVHFQDKKAVCQFLAEQVARLD